MQKKEIINFQEYVRGNKDNRLVYDTEFIHNEEIAGQYMDHDDGGVRNVYQPFPSSPVHILDGARPRIQEKHETEIDQLLKIISSQQAKIESLAAQLSDTKQSMEEAQSNAREALQEANRKSIEYEETISSLQEQLRTKETLSRNHTQSPVANEHYAVLGLDPNTCFVNRSEDEIQRIISITFKLRAQLDHPDTGGDTRQMQKLNEAFNTLRNPNTRPPYKSR